MQIHLFSESLLAEEYLHKGGEQAMLTAGPPPGSVQNPSRIRQSITKKITERLKKDKRY